MQAHPALARIALASLIVLGACDDDNDDTGQISGVIDRCFQRVDLVGSVDGAATRTDPNLINAWGIAPVRGAFAIAATDAGVLAMYNADGTPASLAVPDGLEIGEGYTGVARTAGDDLVLVSEDGLVSTISTNVAPTQVSVQVDQQAAGAGYKGVAVVGDHILAADFRRGRVEEYDASFQLVSDAALVNSTLPAGYAPFNIATVDDEIYVTYALQNEEGDEEVTGAGLGFVSAFDLDGNLLWTLGGEPFDAPWGMALAPQQFGALAGALLVGNFGDGRVTIVDRGTHALLGQLRDADGTALVTDGLWGLASGEEVDNGGDNAVYFSAGPADESQGLFGAFQPCP